MASRATTITTAVADLLTSANLPMGVSRQSGATNIHLDGNTNTNCFVYPGATSVTAETRGWSRREVTVFIHLFRFLDGADETAQVDGRMTSPAAGQVSHIHRSGAQPWT